MQLRVEILVDGGPPTLVVGRAGEGGGLLDVEILVDGGPPTLVVTHLRRPLHPFVEILVDGIADRAGR